MFEVYKNYPDVSPSYISYSTLKTHDMTHTLWGVFASLNLACIQYILL